MKGANDSPPPLFGGLTPGLSALGSGSAGAKTLSKYQKCQTHDIDNGLVMRWGVL